MRKLLTELEVVYRYGPGEGALGRPTCGRLHWCGAQGPGGHRPSWASPFGHELAL